MKTALIQMPVVKDKAENLARAAKEIQRAARDGAELAILPEMFCCPYSNASFRANAEEAGGRIHAAMAEAARKAGLWLVAGLFHRCRHCALLRLRGRRLRGYDRRGRVLREVRPHGRGSRSRDCVRRDRGRTCSDRSPVTMQRGLPEISVSSLI